MIRILMVFLLHKYLPISMNSNKPVLRLHLYFSGRLYFLCDADFVLSFAYEHNDIHLLDVRLNMSPYTWTFNTNTCFKVVEIIVDARKLLTASITCLASVLQWLRRCENPSFPNTGKNVLFVSVPAAILRIFCWETHSLVMPTLTIIGSLKQHRFTHC